MDNSGIRGFALSMLDKRLTEQQKQSPEVQEIIRIIKENDEAKGIEFADNFCKARGISRQDAVGNALKDLGLG